MGTADEVKKQVIGVQAALEQSVLDHGPISVHKKMRSDLPHGPGDPFEFVLAE
jgi:hypothetical protein